MCSLRVSGIFMKEIYLIRHTTPEVESGICYGYSDLNVTENFIEESNDIKLALKKFKPDLVYSSPLLRCSKLTASLFPNQLTQFDDRIKELNFGDWEMKPWNGIDKELISEWSKDFITLSPPQGESFQQLYKRANDFWKKEIATMEDANKVVIITHSGVMRCYLSKFLHIPLARVFSVKLNYGAVFKINIHDNFEEVEFVK